MSASEPFVWAEVSGFARHGAVRRAGALTPYVAQLIVDDARRAGPGGLLEVIVPRCSADAVLSSVEDRFAALRVRGVRVAVRRGRRALPAAPRQRAAGRAA